MREKKINYDSVWDNRQEEELGLGYLDKIKQKRKRAVRK